MNSDLVEPLEKTGAHSDLVEPLECRCCDGVLRLGLLFHPLAQRRFDIAGSGGAADGADDLSVCGQLAQVAANSRFRGLEFPGQSGDAP